MEYGCDSKTIKELIDKVIENTWILLVINRQTTTTISCDNDKELTDKVNKLCAVGDMPMTIKPTTANVTDTKQWYVVNYFICL